MHKKFKLFYDAVIFFQLASPFTTESLCRIVPSWRNGSARWAPNSQVVGSSPIGEVYSLFFNFLHQDKFRQ